MSAVSPPTKGREKFNVGPRSFRSSNRERLSVDLPDGRRASRASSSQSSDSCIRRESLSLAASDGPVLEERSSQEGVRIASPLQLAPRQESGSGSPWRQVGSNASSSWQVVNAGTQWQQWESKDSEEIGTSISMTDSTGSPMTTSTRVYLPSQTEHDLHQSLAASLAGRFNSSSISSTAKGSKHPRASVAAVGRTTSIRSGRRASLTGAGLVHPRSAPQTPRSTIQRDFSALNGLTPGSPCLEIHPDGGCSPCPTMPLTSPSPQVSRTSSANWGGGHGRGSYEATGIDRFQTGAGRTPSPRPSVCALVETSAGRSSTNGTLRPIWRTVSSRGLHGSQSGSDKELKCSSSAPLDCFKSISSRSSPFKGKQASSARNNNPRLLKSCSSHSLVSNGALNGAGSISRLSGYVDPDLDTGLRPLPCWRAWLVEAKRKTSPHCRALIKNRFFQISMFLALIAALVLPDLWVVFDRPDNTDLDVLLTLVLAMFLAELVVQSIGLTSTYWGSFFFWMDLLGAVSVLLDLSYLPLGLTSANGNGGAVSENMTIMRMARIAKLGARAGRFSKLVKLLRFLPGMRMHQKDQGTAKVITQRVITALSTRVSCLIILLVMTTPLFSIWTYPIQDWSTAAWLDILNQYSLSSPERFREQLDAFIIFYEDMDYYPYEVAAKSLNFGVGLLPWVSPRGSPQRAANSIRYETDHLVFDFSFKVPNQISSLMNVVLTVLIMILMLCFSLVLSKSTAAIVLQPLEKVLSQVKQMASTIFQSVTDMALILQDPDKEEQDVSDDGDDPSAALGCETQLLEKVLQKLLVLSELTVNKNVMDEETLANLGEDDLAFLDGYTGARAGTNHFVRRPSRSDEHHDSEDSDVESEPDAKNVLLAQNAMLESAGLSLEMINSWDLNPLTLDKVRNHAAAMYFLGRPNHGIQFDSVLMRNFLESAENGYTKTIPYHNWFHAVDVTHGVYHIMHLCKADHYLSTCERFALLVSATCHDVGHPGLNNGFLTEASHELALRYNDKSPLENMHCARLFEFLSMPRCNIVGDLNRQNFLEVRKSCIEAILHTDNAKHFAMIMEVRTLYEVNSEIMDMMREHFLEHHDKFLTKDATELFRQPESRRLLVQLLLHMSDISNCTKPFRICRLWALRIMDEFFLQGDEEKRLELPVQALNDREKVNPFFSQVNFIEFLVCPFFFAVVKVMPPMDESSEQMVSNAKSWYQCWLVESKTPPPDSERQTVADRVAMLEQKCRDCRRLP